MKLQGILLGILMFVVACVDVSACTSAIVSGSKALYGRTMLWKHRDSGFPDNFIGKVERTDSTMAYVALFNAGDDDMREAWAGMNEAGFAVMNTASYNLAPDTAIVKDREGVVMSLALKTCRVVDDFRRLLEREQAKGTLGVQANFGVIDSIGNGAYFETSDHSFTMYPLADASDGCLIRSNYSYSGGDEGKLGAVRHDNAVHLLAEPLKRGVVTPETFTEQISRSFYHAKWGRDMWQCGYAVLTDRGEYIPRRSSCASVVMECGGEGAPVMWVVMGCPEVSVVQAVTLDFIPDNLLPIGENGHSPLCDEANGRRELTFPRKGSEGKWLIDMRYLRKVTPQLMEISARNYAEGRQRLGIKEKEK